MVTRKFLIGLTNQILETWEKNEDKKSPIKLEITNAKDLKKLREAIKKKYIDMRCIQYPTDLKGTGFEAPYFEETINKSNPDKTIITTEKKYIEVYVSYSWYARDEIYKSKSLQIEIDQKKYPNVWWLSKKGEKLLESRLDLIWYK